MIGDHLFELVMLLQLVLSVFVLSSKVYKHGDESLDRSDELSECSC